MGTSDLWPAKRKLINEWNTDRDGPLIDRKNFETFVAIEEVNTWDQFQGLLSTQLEHLEWIFRGQSNSRWRLETTLERAVIRHVEISPGQAPVEHWMAHPHTFFERRVLFFFKRRAHHYTQNLPGEDEVLDWFALMQHYGVPTRLLDWTFSPYVALYFALETSVPDESCAVWAVNSGWVVEQANKTLKEHDPNFPETPHIEAFNRYLNGSMLREETPSVVVIGNPIRMNERSATQQGVFLCDLGRTRPLEISLLDMMVTDPPADLPPLWKIVISPKTTSERVRFFRELVRMNVRGDALFPGLDGFARSIRLQLQADVDSLYSLVDWRLTKPPAL